MLTRRMSFVSGSIAVACLGLSMLPARPSDASMSRDKRMQIITAVPLIVTVAEKDGKVLGIASFGSGTVVSPRGHIFTNNHVISFNHPLPNGITIKPERYIFLTLKNNEDPVPVCSFDPSHMPSDSVVDIAMVMCEHDLKGNPWDPNKFDWPSMPLGDPKDMVQGDDLWVFGYPGAGVDPRRKERDLFLLPTMNVSAGKFSGVVNEQVSETEHQITWIKTDAEVSGGNSGGCATDEDGNYVGIPTEVHTDTRDTHSGDGGTLGHVSFLRPVTLLKPYYEMAKAGWTPGSAAEGGQVQGVGVTVSGGVASADTGDPVPNIIVIVFKAGVSASAVMKAAHPGELVMTRGVSDAQGQFTLMDKVQPGKYTVAVVGQGYKLVIEDDALVVDANTPAAYRAWNKIPVTRCSSGPDCVQ